MKSFICILILVNLVTAQQMRGVPPAKLHLYRSDTFTCTSGSKKIDISYVNDDYCDCDDGSDEPGTPACAEGHYYCQNKGFRGKEIPSAQVNDGICDCCDGSDEYGTKRCGNTCREMAVEIKGDIKKEAQQHMDGSRIKEQWIADSAQIRGQWKADIAKYQIESEELTPEWEKLKQKKEEEDKLETEENDKRDKLREAAEALANQTISESEPGSVESEPGSAESEPGTDSSSDAKDPNHADPKVDGADPPNEEAAPSFPYPEEYRFNDDSTKVEEGAPSFPYPEEYRFNDDSTKVEEGKDESDDAEEIIQEEEQQQEEENDSNGDAKSEEDTEGVKVDFSRYTSQAATDARDAFNTVDNKKKAADKKIEDLKKDLEYDYGENDEFLKLKGECISLVYRQYTYKVCPYDNAKQGSTSLGSWEKLDNREALSFTGGQKCWNGPERSLKVTLKCGLENIIKEVEEPSTCVYAMVMETPAVCSHSHATALLMNLEMEVDEEL